MMTKPLAPAQNTFGTEYGALIYYVAVDFEHVHAERGIVQPLDTAARADWAIGVLSKRYPERSYESVRRLAPDNITAEQMEVFAAPVLDDLSKLELADKMGVDYYQ